MQNNSIRSILWGFILSFVLILSACQDEPKLSSDNQKISFLALGDSYTIGESVAKDQRWPVLLADSLQKRDITVEDPKIIAQTGWTTNDLQKAIEKENLRNNYDIVSLLIGVNNQYQGIDFEQFETEFEQLLNQAISLAGDDSQSVFVVSIPDYSVTPFGQQKTPETISRELKKYNRTASTIAASQEVSFINITPISQNLTDSSLIADDGLHPSGKMYQQWVKEIVLEVLPKFQPKQ